MATYSTTMLFFVVLCGLVSLPATQAQILLVTHFDLNLTSRIIRFHFNVPAIAGDSDMAGGITFYARNDTSSKNHTLLLDTFLLGPGNRTLPNPNPNPGPSEPSTMIQFPLSEYDRDAIRLFAVDVNSTFLSGGLGIAIAIYPQNESIHLLLSRPIDQSALLQVTTFVGPPPPDLISFDLDMDSGTFTLAFTQPVFFPGYGMENSITFSSSQSDEADLYIYIYMLSYIITTCNCLAGSLVYSFTMHSIDINALKSFPDIAKFPNSTFIELSDGLFRDHSNQTSGDISGRYSRQVNDYIADTAPPNLLSVSLDLSHSEFIMDFDEPIFANTVNISIVLHSAFENLAILLIDALLSNFSPKQVFVFGYPLYADQVKYFIKDLNLTQYDVHLSGRSFVIDTAGNSINILASDSVVCSISPDFLAPVLTSFHIDLDQGSLFLTYTEAVKIKPSLLTSLRFDKLFENNGSNMTLYNSFQPSFGVAVDPSRAYYSDLVELPLLVINSETFTYSDNDFVDDGFTYLHTTGSIVCDVFSNEDVAIPQHSPLLASQVIPDVTGPVLKYVSFDFNNGHTFLSFDDVLNVSTVYSAVSNVTFSILDLDFGSTFIPRISYTVSFDPLTSEQLALLADKNISVELTTISNTDLNMLKSMFASSLLEGDSNYIMVSIDEGFVFDTSDNPSFPVVSAFVVDSSLVIFDFTPPEFQTSFLDLNIGEIVLLFNEPVYPTERVFEGFYLLSNSTAIDSLDLSPITVQQINSTAIRLPISTLNLNIMKCLVAISDTISLNRYEGLNIVVDYFQVPLDRTPPRPVTLQVVLDTTPPSLISANAIDCSLFLAFDEPVNPITIDPSLLTILNYWENSTSYSLTGGTPLLEGDCHSFADIEIELSERDCSEITRQFGNADFSDHSKILHLMFREPGFIHDLLGNIIQPSDGIPLVFVFPTVCPGEDDAVYDIFWPATISGSTAIQSCYSQDTNQSGSASRCCNEITGNWEPSNVSECFLFTFVGDDNDILTTNLVNVTGSRTSPSTIDPVIKTIIVNTTQFLLNSTNTADTNTTLFPRDLNATNVFLNLAARYSNSTTLLDAEIAENLFTVADQILEPALNPQWQELSEDEFSPDASLLLQSVEEVALSFAFMYPKIQPDNTSSIGTTEMKYAGQRLTVKASQIAPDTAAGSEGISFDDVIYPLDVDIPGIPPTIGRPSQLPRVEIPMELLQERAKNDMDPVIVVNALFSNLQLVLPSRLSDGSPLGKLQVSPIILSTQVANVQGISQALQTRPINLTFPIEDNVTSAVCAYFKFTSDSNQSLSGWAVEGLTQGERDGKVLCQSTHLTSFVILVDYTGVIAEAEPENDLLFTVLSVIGCGISSICLLLSIVFFLSLGKELYTNSVHFVHLNLCISLLMGLALFIVVSGLGFEGKFSQPAGCSVLTSLLHYFLLAAFSWMLCEGVMMYVLLVRVFGAHERKWLVLYSCIGWGFPVIPVVISIGVAFGLNVEYFIHASDSRAICWLSQKYHLIWAFLVPVMLILLVNLFFFLRVVYAIVKSQQSRLKQTYSQKRNQILLRHTLYAFMALSPLMGATWVFGLLAANNFSEVLRIIFSWLFIVCNTLQGLVFFIFHVVRHEKIWSKLKVAKERFSSKSTKTTTSKKKTDTFGRPINSDKKSNPNTSNVGNVSTLESSIVLSDCWEVPLLEDSAFQKDQNKSRMAGLMIVPEDGEIKYNPLSSEIEEDLVEKVDITNL